MILLQLLQGSKKSRSHYSTMNHTTSQLVKRSDTLLSLPLAQWEKIRAFEIQNHDNCM